MKHISRRPQLRGARVRNLPLTMAMVLLILVIIFVFFYMVLRNPAH